MEWHPLYVALLASFAQAYRINLSPRMERNPTIRLVVLDEAFSKMDAEKVASCIELIRGLGFQAIISACSADHGRHHAFPDRLQGRVRGH